MIKIDTGKGKLLSFDIDIEGGNDSEIKEGRFILSCPNKTYRLMFKAIIEDGSVMVDLPPLDINEKSGECFLEMISTDNQYYPVWEDKVKFDRSLTIKIKEQKDKKLKVSLNENEDIETIENKKQIIKEKKIVKSSNTVTLYRTIKCNEQSINKVLSENKFSMKPKSNIPVKFYKSDEMLINDLENIDFGVSIGMSVPENGIMEQRKDKSIIVDSSYLDTITEKNVIFIINNGRLIKLDKDSDE